MLTFDLRVIISPEFSLIGLDSGWPKGERMVSDKKRIIAEQICVCVFFEQNYSKREYSKGTKETKRSFKKRPLTIRQSYVS